MHKCERMEHTRWDYEDLSHRVSVAKEKQLGSFVTGQKEFRDETRRSRRHSEDLLSKSTLSEGKAGRIR